MNILPNVFRSENTANDTHLYMSAKKKEKERKSAHNKKKVTNQVSLRSSFSRSSPTNGKGFGTDEALEVQAMVNRVRQGSPYLQEAVSQVTAHFYRDEIKTAPVPQLSGEFCQILQVLELPKYSGSHYANVGLTTSGVPSTIRVDHATMDGLASTQTALSTTHLSQSPEEAERRNVCTSGGTFSLKQLRPPKKRLPAKLARLHTLAAATLVLEAQFLARMNHENIVALRGIPLGEDMCDKANQFFLLTDGIVETLAERIPRWQVEQDIRRRQAPPRHGGCGLRLDTTSNQFAEQLQIAKSVASALAYIQRHCIVLLNLSPNTIGFRLDGKVQLFELGHCREIRESSNDFLVSGTGVASANISQRSSTSQSPADTQMACKKGGPSDNIDSSNGLSEDELSVDDLSVMLGSPIITPDHADIQLESAQIGMKTGAFRKIIPTASMSVVPRYLAPEVVTRGQYTLQSDAYSFALVLFHMFTLSTPYATHLPGHHFVQVCIQGRRPNIALYQFPSALENLIRKGWKHNWNKRLSIATMERVLNNAQFGQSSSSLQRIKQKQVPDINASVKKSSQRVPEPPSGEVLTTNRSQQQSSAKQDHLEMPRPRRAGRRPAPPKPLLKSSQYGSDRNLSAAKLSTTKSRHMLPRPKSDRNLLFGAMLSPASRKKQTVEMANKFQRENPIIQLSLD